jgi:hypothetical protein
VIDLDAYAADCRLFGSVELGDGRLTDLLNEESELRIIGARLESLADGHVSEVAELVVNRDEVCAVVAVGPRGSAARRLHTHTRNVVVEMGPYEIRGAIHGTAASNPLAGVLRRAPWVPLTDAVISYLLGARTIHHQVDTLLINRALASSIRAAEEEPAPYLPWEGPGAPPVKTPGTLDLTSAVHDEDPGQGG